MKTYRLILAIVVLCAAFSLSLNTAAQGRTTHVIMSADVSSGKLKTFGGLTVSSTAGIAGTESLTKNRGSIWELSSEKSVTFTFELPQGAQNVRMKVREVGYPNNTAEKTVFTINGQQLTNPSAKPNTRKTHQFKELAGKIQTGNNVIKVNVNEGSLGLQTLAISFDLLPVTTTWGDGMSLTLLSPIAGQVVSTDGEITISWESNNLTADAMVAVQYREGSNPWQIIEQVPHNHPSKRGNQGNIQWTPSSASDNLQFRVLYKGDSEATPTIPTHEEDEPTGDETPPPEDKEPTGEVPDRQQTQVAANLKRITGKDGVPMVVIPAGEFQMGSNDDNYDEKPAHTVYLDAYSIDVYEVTNAQFKKFLEANSQWRKNKIDPKYHDGHYLKDWNGMRYPKGKANHPVVYVSWYAAAAYAQWAQKTLPTEAQWEKAARGSLVGKKYPWGDTISRKNANYYGKGGRDKWDKTSPAGSFPANSYGLYDMAGNVWEWCADEYDSDYYSKSSKSNPTGPGTPVSFVGGGFTSVTTRRVFRGGSWGIINNTVRCANRDGFSPTFTLNNVGFRCVTVED